MDSIETSEREASAPVSRPVRDSELPSVAPRITPADIENEIAFEAYFTAADGYRYKHYFEAERVKATPQPLELLTICVLILRNGFTVVGKSGVASPENFNESIGNRIARENAVREIWPLMGYQLRSALANTPPPISNAFVAPGCEKFAEPAATTFQDRVRTERAELAEKVEKLTAFRATDRWADVHPSEQYRLRAQLSHMENYLQILDDRIASFQPVEA